MSQPEPCANWYGTRRHLSVDLEPLQRGGREGGSLCSRPGNPVTVFDQDALDAYRQALERKAIVVADLPECKHCAREAAKRLVSDVPEEG